MTLDEERAEAIQAVERWMYARGEHPEDIEFVMAIEGLAAEWHKWRESGMDVVATSMLERIEAICKALRDE